MSTLLRSATMAAAGSKLLQARHLSISAASRLQHFPPRENLNSSAPTEGPSPLKIRMGILAQESPPSNNKAGSKFLRRLGRAMAAKPLRETVEELAAGIVYAEEPGGSGLVVVNKPYGLPVNAAEDSPVSLTACLPGLAERLGAGDIKIIIFYIYMRQDSVASNCTCASIKLPNPHPDSHQRDPDLAPENCLAKIITYDIKNSLKSQFWFLFETIMSFLYAIGLRERKFVH